MPNAEAGVLERAYSNVYAMVDALCAVKEKNIEHPPSDYGNPVQFFRTHVIYISVSRGALSPHHAMRLRNHRLKHEHYLPESMKHLEGHICKETYAVAEDVFEHIFLRDFVSQYYLAYLRRGH